MPDYLKPGDMVVVRPAHEILATLDASGALDNVPFMPEMLAFIGKPFVVSQRVEKICDTIGEGGSRRMRDTVFLAGLRCGGCAHGGCEAECRIYWKEAWLSASDATPQRESDDRAAQELRRRAVAGARRPAAGDDDAEFFRCQATEAYRATEPLAKFEMRQYVRELRAGNVTLRRLLRVGLRAILWRGSRIVGKPLAPSLAPLPAGEPSAALGLKPGDWIEVRSPDEIARTLNKDGRNRGLAFSPAEMLPACGRRFQVRRRVGKLIDEKSGRLLTIKNDCVVLEGLVCNGELASARWFCRRELFPYWREAWLKRVE